MRKIKFSLLLLISTFTLGLASCGTNNNTSDGSSTKPSDPPVEIITYSATVKYTFNNFDISTSTFTIKSDQLSDKSYITSKLSLPSEYVRADDQIYLRDTDYTNNKKTYEVFVKPTYDGYILVKSSDSTINNQLVPASILSDNLSSTVKTTTTFSGQPATYSLSNITEIKFKNSSKIDINFKVSEYNWSSLSSLTKIDVSELKYLKEIPNNFFSYCKNLKTVDVGSDGFKNIIHVGHRFLAGCSLSSCNFDFSNVTKIGNNFMFCALRDLTGTAIIRFRDLDPTTGASVLYQSRMQTNTKIELYLNNIIPTSNWFHRDDSIGYSDYPSFIETGLLNWVIVGTVLIHSNYVSQVQTVVEHLNNNGASITVVS